MSRLIIHNAKIVNEGSSMTGYVVIDGKFIHSVTKGKLPSRFAQSDDKVVDAEGAYLMPGVIDDHVHFREPGLTQKADMATESVAAVAGGVTSFMDMPNTRPATVTLSAWRDKMKRASEVSRANYAFYIGATNDNIDELLAVDYTEVPGVKLFMGSSTGNMLVDSDSMLHRVFDEVPALIAVHAEDEARIRTNREMAQEIFGNEPLPVDMHSMIRDTMACYLTTKRAIELAREAGARLHILHISTAAELKLLEPVPMEQRKITAETCIQYMWWSDKDYETMGTRIKCNPSIKAETDRRALLRAVRDGLIDVMGSDHAPHLLSEKDGDAITAMSGCPNMQTALIMMMELVTRKAFKVETVVERMAHAPARLFGIDRRGFIRPGYYADIVLVETCEPYVITDADSKSRCGWLPIAGTELSHRVKSTWVNGNLAYSDKDDVPFIAGMPLRFLSK